MIAAQGIGGTVFSRGKAIRYFSDRVLGCLWSGWGRRRAGWLVVCIWLADGISFFPDGALKTDDGMVDCFSSVVEACELCDDELVLDAVGIFAMLECSDSDTTKHGRTIPCVVEEQGCVDYTRVA